MRVAVQKFRNFEPVSLPKVKKAAFNTELRKQGSHRTKSDLNIWISVTRSNCRAVKSLSFFTLIVLLLVVLLFVDLLNVASCVLTYLLSVASLFCLSMFCRTADLSDAHGSFYSSEVFNRAWGENNVI